MLAVEIREICGHILNDNELSCSVGHGRAALLSSLNMAQVVGALRFDARPHFEKALKSCREHGLRSLQSLKLLQFHGTHHVYSPYGLREGSWNPCISEPEAHL